MIGKMAKAWTVLSVGGLAWITAVVASDPKAITGPEWITGLGVLVATVGVWLVPNAARSE